MAWCCIFVVSLLLSSTSDRCFVVLCPLPFCFVLIFSRFCVSYATSIWLFGHFIGGPVPRTLWAASDCLDGIRHRYIWSIGHETGNGRLCETQVLPRKNFPGKFVVPGKSPSLLYKQPLLVNATTSTTVQSCFLEDLQFFFGKVSQTRISSFDSRFPKFPVPTNFF
jgi:hypothetical protein